MVHVLAHTFLFKFTFHFQSKEVKKNRNTEQCVIKCGVQLAQRVPFMMAHLLLLLYIYKYAYVFFYYAHAFARV